MTKTPLLVGCTWARAIPCECATLPPYKDLIKWIAHLGSFWCTNCWLIVGLNFKNGLYTLSSHINQVPLLFWRIFSFLSEYYNILQTFQILSVLNKKIMKMLTNNIFMEAGHEKEIFTILLLDVDTWYDTKI